MKKLTHEQVKDRYVERLSQKDMLKGGVPVDSYLIIEAIVDSFNESIEDHNNKNYICNKCDGYLSHTGRQKMCAPPIDIYECKTCNKEVWYKEEKIFKINPNDDQP